MPAKKLREFLDDQGIECVAIPHQVAYTARQIAAVTHVPKKDFAKPGRGLGQCLERETGFEPATSTLARSHSTAELLPLGKADYKRPIRPGQTPPVQTPST